MTLTVSRSTARPTVPALGYLAAVVLLAGCASVLDGEGSGGGSRTDDPGSAPYDHASGPEDVLVSIKVDGGFVPVEYNLRNTPELLLLGDGTAIVGGVMIEIYPGPAIAPMQSATVPEGQIQQLFAMAENAGLLGAEIDFGDPGVTDLATTYVEITVDGRTVSQAAYALDYEDESNPDMTEASRAARAALREFIAAGQAMVGSGSEPYQPDALLAHRVRVSDEIPRDPEFGQLPQAWPIATAPPPIAPTYPSSCVAILGEEAAVLFAALAEANELTSWQIDMELPARMAFRPLLPGDPGCQE